MPSPGAVRAAGEGDRGAPARARRLPEADEGRPADLRARAALPAAAGLRLGRGATPTSSSAAPTRSSTCSSPATSRAAYGEPQQSIMTMPILPGHRRRAEDEQVAGQLRRRDRSARGDVRQADAGPRRGDGHVLPAAARRGAVPRRRPGRGEAGARPAPRRALPRRADAAAAAEAHFDRVHVAHEIPGRVEEVDLEPWPAARGVHLPRADRPTPSGSARARRGGCSARAASSSTARRSRPSRSTCRAGSSTARSCRSASAASQLRRRA